MVAKINLELSTQIPIVYKDAEKLKLTLLSSGLPSQHFALPSPSPSFPGEEVELSEMLYLRRNGRSWRKWRKNMEPGLRNVAVLGS